MTCVSSFAANVFSSDRTRFFESSRARRLMAAATFNPLFKSTDFKGTFLICTWGDFFVASIVVAKFSSSSCNKEVGEVRGALVRGWTWWRETSTRLTLIGCGVPRWLMSAATLRFCGDRTCFVAANKVVKYFSTISKRFVAVFFQNVVEKIGAVSLVPLIVCSNLSLRILHCSREEKLRQLSCFFAVEMRCVSSAGKLKAVSKRGILV